VKDLMAKLDRAFNPRSVAVVGDSTKLDYMWLNAMRTFQGEVYSVQVNPKDIPHIQKLGFDNYHSLLDIPGPVDYVVLSVPRKVVPQIISDCIQKGVAGVSLFTSGFAETHTEDGLEYQQRLTAMAEGAGLVLIGPNCMGIYNRRLGLRQNPEQPVGEGGEVGFISQSGTHAVLLSLAGAYHGIKLSKSVSYGNAIVLDSPDYLEYMAQDPETRVIAMYIEGVKEGRRFFEVLRRAARAKPVVVWKGGRTEDGFRATSSHTAALAQSPQVWHALVKQCGAIQVDSFDSLLDTLKVLLHCKPTTGHNLALVAMSGGQSVAIADAFTEAGFRAPPLTETSYRELASFFDIIGGSYQNPFDIAWNVPSVEGVMKLIGIVDRDENIDGIVLEIGVFFLERRWREKWADNIAGLIDALARFKAQSRKPLLVVVVPTNREEAALELMARLGDKGIPGLPSFERGAVALRRVVDYYRARHALGQ